MLQPDVVISGLSGRFPESDTVEEFKENLYNGVDMVTDDERRWPRDLYNMPTRLGKIKDLALFDAAFFGIHAKQTHAMDPQIRILLEVTYEAIIDAGINPNDLRGSKTGVYIGASFSESGEMWTRPENIHSYSTTGYSKSMFSNRISFSFDLKGPSLTVDTACSSSLYALHLAVQAIRAGECDAAVVGGTSMDLKPASLLRFHKHNMLSPEGKCKAFDAEGNGYVRSEAVVVVFLQKSEVAKRIYATVINTKTNSDGYTDQGITYPSGLMQMQLLKQIYDESGLDPSNVYYIEAHGTGTPVGDPVEVNAIAQIFCRKRQDPLLIGSVKSNMGHSESSAGLSSIAKILIAMETGVIPSNLHFKSPNPAISPIINGQIKVVDKPTSWKGNITSVNSFGFGGANAHVILKINPKTNKQTVMKLNRRKEGLEKLIVVSGRTKKACEVLFDSIIVNKNNDEFIGLLHSIFQHNILRHDFRGYCVLGDTHISEIENYQSAQEKRPIWFVFSGMGTQWPGMGKDLLEIEMFKMSFQRCSEVLKPEGIDLMDLMFNNTEETFYNVINTFIMIISIQIGLVDVLKSVGIKPDGIVGLSVGELACAYADGSLTLEQTILSAYWRGRVLTELELIPGGMAVVGLTLEETAKICPSDIELAVYTSFNLVTVAGPIQSIQQIVKHLKSKNIFATVINSCGFAFHSKYIKDAGSKLRSILEKIIPSPQKRSSAWLSSSIPKIDWNTSKAKFSSPEYFVNNLLLPVNFYETIKLIPDNAITIEIAPHCSLRTVMKKSLPETSTYIGLHNRDHSSNIAFLLSSIGKLHNNGAQPDVSKLYPSVKFPVSRGTPMLNSLISWDHSTRWTVPDFYTMFNNTNESIIEIDISKEHKFLAGHSIEGHILFPATGYLVLVWEAFANIKNIHFEKLPITFEEVKFLRATVLPKEGKVKFVVKILPNGIFEICESGSSVVTGTIKIQNEYENYALEFSERENNDNKQTEINKNDIYKYFRLRGYNYSGIFQGVQLWNRHMKTGKLCWVKNWIAFMDTMLQVYFLATMDSTKTFLPARLQYVAIDPFKQLPYGDNRSYTVTYYPELKIINAGGVQVGGIKLSLGQTYKKNQHLLNLDIYNFEPYDNDDKKKTGQDVLKSFISIIEENIGCVNLKGIETFSSEKELIGPLILNICDNIPHISCDIQLSLPVSTDYEIKFERIKKKSHNFAIAPVEKTVHFITANNVLSTENSEILLNLIKSLKTNGYIILIETGIIKMSLIKDHGLVLVARQRVSGKTYLLLAKIEKQNDSIIIDVTEKKFIWLEKLKFALTQKRKILLVAQGEATSGIIGFCNSVRRESKECLQIRYVFIQDDTAPAFSITEPIYATQLEKNLYANVLKEKKWGWYHYLSLKKTDLSNTIQMEHAYVNTLIKGNLNSLNWIKNNLNNYKEESTAKKIYSVYYAPLSFRDVMLATGKITADALPGNLVNEDCVLGLEFVGRDSSGRRVMGMVPAKGLATTVLVDPNDFVLEVPQKWTMEQAATILVCYATSYYALIVRGKLKKGESVLIHSGAGGVGLASITVALNYGCTVFTTVGTDEKREFLKKRFPLLTDRNIGNSRDTSFEKLVLKETHGRGVDVVLNSLANEKLKASLRCLAVKGRFLEIGKVDLSNDNTLGMAFFLKNTTFHGILLDDLCYGDSNEKQQVLQLLREGILNDDIKPLPSTVFSENQIEEGFRYMAKGKHIGKIIIKIRDEETEEITKPSVKTVAGLSKTYLHPDKCYILVGGLGGFGLELANWMISRGAKYIILTTRSGIKTGYQSWCVDRWKKQGTNVVISKKDVTTLEDTEKLLLESNKIAPIGGIINLAAVLHDRLLENLNMEHFELVSKPKFSATKNLDILSRKYCPMLDFFVVMSSLVASFGSPGQSNYALANSSMERLIEQRRAAGFPGLAIQWGPLGDVGMIIDIVGGNNDTVIHGCAPQRMDSCLDTMDLFLENNFGGVVRSWVLKDEKAHSEDNIHENNLMQEIGHIMGIKDFQSVNSTSTLLDFGIDSMISSEIKQTLQRKYDILLSYKEIHTLTFAKLKEMTCGSNQGRDVK